MKEQIRTKTRKPRTKPEKAELSSGNIFADLGFLDGDERLWTQSQAAERTGLDQPKVSRLIRGQLSGFSADRLFAALNRLGHSIEVRISAKERSPEKSHTHVMIA